MNKQTVYKIGQFIARLVVIALLVGLVGLVGHYDLINLQMGF